MGMRSYAVVGMGAIGGYYGARLADAGHDVHFLVRSHASQLRAQGLRVESPEGDVVVRDVQVHTDPESVPPVDVVVVAVKTTDSASVLPAVGRLARRGAIVVAMQNGLGVEQVLADAAPGST